MKWSIKGFNELNINELYEICKSRYEVFACEQKIVDENDFDDIDKNVYHIFLEDNGRVVAYARIIPSGIVYEEASIGRVLVLSNYRRQGIAENLIKKSLKFIREELKEEKIKLSAQVYIKEMYEKIGFYVISDIYDEVGIPHVKMIFK